MAQSTYSLSFDGVDDLVQSGFTSILDGATAFSASVWIKPNSTQAVGFPRVFQVDDAQDFYLLLQGAATTIRLGLRGFTVDGTLTADAWNHAGVRWDGTTARLYIDGVSAGSVGVTGALSASGVRLSLGNRVSDAGRGLVGFLDDAALWTSDIGASNLAGIADGSIDVSTLSPLLLWRIEDGGSGTTLTDTGSAGVNGTLGAGWGVPAWSTDVASQLSGGSPPPPPAVHPWWQYATQQVIGGQ